MRHGIFIVAVSSLLLSLPVLAKDNKGQKLAVSQGISSPTITSPVNFSHGRTFANSAVASQYQGPQLSLEADTRDDDNGNDDMGYGGEFGLGTGTAGIALGYYTRDCDGCDGRVGGIAGIGGSSIAGGIGFREEDTFSGGLLFNRDGKHRFGITADMFNSDLDNGDLMSYGAGYSYVGSSFVFAVDASKRDSDSPSPNNDDIIMVTPGLEVHSDRFALSVSYDAYLNDDNDTEDNDVWFGLGISGKSWHVAIYHDYVNEWSGALTFWF